MIASDSKLWQMMAKDSKLWQMMAKHGKHSITITINKTITINRREYIWSSIGFKMKFITSLYHEPIDYQVSLYYNLSIHERVSNEG